MSIHAKHTVETTKLINEELLSIIRKPIYFINTARGEIVDEDALLKFIKKGKIKKAAIDVLTNESRQDISKNPYFTMLLSWDVNFSSRKNSRMWVE